MKSCKCKLFLSWSGDRSKAVADQLHKWINAIFEERISVFFSKSDIWLGEQWLNELLENLETIDSGIICITDENKDKPWLVFEAGSLSKLRDRSCVIPLLIGLNLENIPEPLRLFQAATIPTKANMHEIAKSLNRLLDKKDQLKKTDLKNVCGEYWDDLHEVLESVLSQSKSSDKQESVSKDLEYDVDYLERKQRLLAIYDFRKGLELPSWTSKKDCPENILKREVEEFHLEHPFKQGDYVEIQRHVFDADNGEIGEVTNVSTKSCFVQILSMPDRPAREFHFMYLIRLKHVRE